MRVAKLALTIILVPIISCGGGGGDGGTTNPPPATVSSVTLNKTSALLRPSESVTITATAKDASGNTVTGHAVTWNNSNTAVATITPNGSSVTVTAAGLGTTGVSATVDQITSSQASITVTNNFPTSADVSVGPNGTDTFSPSQVDIAAGGSVNFTWNGVLHNVTWTQTPTSVSNSGDKSSGSFSVTLNQPGSYGYQCTIHAGMTGNVTVH